MVGVDAISTDTARGLLAYGFKTASLGGVAPPVVATTPAAAPSSFTQAVEAHRSSRLGFEAIDPQSRTPSTE